jgi:putative two-component system response regulator
MKILIVEDDPTTLEILEQSLLWSRYDVLTARNGREAMDLLLDGECRIVISDWMMPEMDGLELCQAIRQEIVDRYIYVILLTSRAATSDIVEGFSAGVDDYISKPFEPAELLARLHTAERILMLETRDVTIFAMAKLAESRDPETGEHLERVREYSRALATELMNEGPYVGMVDREFIRLIYLTSPLHDIGKVSIPDYVLLKPGRLDEQEFNIMKKHAEAGAHTITLALRQFPGARFLQMAKEIALHHHEKFDGTGYPHALAGEEIPLCARIFCLADVYDALVSKRVYKEAYPHELTKRIILDGKAKHFDPVVVEAFLRCEEEFIRIFESMQDAKEMIELSDT